MTCGRKEVISSEREDEKRRSEIAHLLVRRLLDDLSSAEHEEVVGLG